MVSTHSSEYLISKRDRIGELALRSKPEDADLSTVTVKSLRSSKSQISFDLPPQRKRVKTDVVGTEEDVQAINTLFYPPEARSGSSTLMVYDETSRFQPEFVASSKEAGVSSKNDFVSRKRSNSSVVQTAEASNQEPQLDSHLQHRRSDNESLIAGEPFLDGAEQNMQPVLDEELNQEDIGDRSEEPSGNTIKPARSEHSKNVDATLDIASAADDPTSTDRTNTNDPLPPIVSQKRRSLPALIHAPDLDHTVGAISEMPSESPTSSALRARRLTIPAEPLQIDTDKTNNSTLPLGSDDDESSSAFVTAQTSRYRDVFATPTASSFPIESPALDKELSFPHKSVQPNFTHTLSRSYSPPAFPANKTVKEMERFPRLDGLRVTLPRRANSTREGYRERILLRRAEKDVSRPIVRPFKFQSHWAGRRKDFVSTLM